MADQDDTSKAIWFLAGAAMGATLALLFAPASGQDTRRFIARRAEEGGEILADTGRDVVEKGRDLFDKGRKIADEAADLFDRGRRMVKG